MSGAFQCNICRVFPLVCSAVVLFACHDNRPPKCVTFIVETSRQHHWHSLLLLFPEFSNALSSGNITITTQSSSQSNFQRPVCNWVNHSGNRPSCSHCHCQWSSRFVKFSPYLGMYTVSQKRPPFYFLNNLSKINRFEWFLMCEILRKFDINTLYICPPYLYTVTTLPGKI